MKGWVGLVGWPIADGLPTLVVAHQLQVDRRTGKVRRPETDVLPLCHATNATKVSWFKKQSGSRRTDTSDRITFPSSPLTGSANIVISTAGAICVGSDVGSCLQARVELVFLARKFVTMLFTDKLNSWHKLKELWLMCFCAEYLNTILSLLLWSFNFCEVSDSFTEF